jgi:nucleoside-diphosphate-sugar epimerase
VRLMGEPKIDRVISIGRTIPDMEGWDSPPFTHIHCDIGCPWDVKKIMTASEPQTVFHLAGDAIVREDVDFPTDVTWSNVLPTHNLLAYCPEGCRFVLASSATVYGAGLAHGSCEYDATRPNSIYGATKVAAEALVDAYTRLGRVKGVSLRLVANVGYGASHGVLRDIMFKLLSGSASLALLGDAPGSSKPYLHVSDTTGALLTWACGPPSPAGLSIFRPPTRWISRDSQSSSWMSWISTSPSAGWAREQTGRGTTESSR